jgi:hypothetical protein
MSVFSRFLGTRKEPAAEAVTSPPGAFVLDLHNGILDVDGTATLADAASWLWKRGAFLPMPAPLPAMSFADLCARMPTFVDAVVQQASVITLDGDSAASPKAPRAATGPSITAALSTHPPLVRAQRLRVRVLRVDQCGIARTEHHTHKDAARAIVRHNDDGVAFFAAAFGKQTWVSVTSTAADLLSTWPAFAGASSSSKVVGDVLLPRDADGAGHALSAGQVVWSCPSMGRMCAWRTGVDVRTAATSLDEAAAELVKQMMYKRERR